MDFLKSFWGKTEKYDYEKELLQHTEPMKLKEQTFYKTLSYEKIETIWDLIKVAYKKYDKMDMIGKRRLDDKGNLANYVWESYSEVFESINYISSAFYHLFAALNDGDMSVEELSALMQRHQEEVQVVEGSVVEEANGKVADEGSGESDKEKNDVKDEGRDQGALEIDYFDDKNNTVGIYSVNRTEWITTSIGVQSIAMKTVPLYDSLGKDSAAYVIDHADLKVVVCSKDKVQGLIEAKVEKNLGLKVIVQMEFEEKYNNKKDFLDKDTVNEAKQKGILLLGYSELLKFGKKNMKTFKPTRPKKENLALIMYTSGTSGQPKGVLLTHHNAVSGVKNILKRVDLSGNGKLLSFLPLAHIFENLLEYSMILCGCGIGYFSGSPKTLPSDMLELRPHLFAAVPRVFDRIYSKVMAKIASTGYLKRSLIQYLYRRAVRNSHCPEAVGAKTMLDSSVWARVRRELGFDRISFVLSGGAPCPEHIMEFLRVLLPCPVLQGYGLTETFAAGTITAPEDWLLSNTGHPVGVEVKLAPVPNTDYDAKEGPFSRGELLIRGPNVFVGYHKNKELTQKVLSEDGWFSTGDVARLNANGSISIVDRAKALFKLSQGEYISPEHVECAYSNSPAVNQIFAYGDSKHNFVVAVVVPSVRWLKEFFDRISVRFDDSEKKLFKQICIQNDVLVCESVQKKPEGEKSGEEDGPKENESKEKSNGSLNDQKKAMLDAIAKLGENRQTEAGEALLQDIRLYEKDLQRFEVVKKVFVEFRMDLELNGFTVANDLLTPSYKLRRPFLLKRYQTELDAMYTKS